MENSPIVKCSHCHNLLSTEEFDSHKCEWKLKDVQRIPVAYFRDDSYEDNKIMSGYGLDGVLYSFVVTSRTAIPYCKGLSDDCYHEPQNRRKVTRTLRCLLSRLEKIRVLVCT